MRDAHPCGARREASRTALAGGFAVYGTLKKLTGPRLDAEEEFNGADLSIHRISAAAERETLW